mmetsp:Transcript_4127/g.12888  ORF Transcript_4127/g.12888 Transcript_4127/m.12888 type:complete len:200 (+) Transcript_4127:710-1309(+)
MAVAHARNVLRGAAVLNGNAALVDELAGVGAHNGNAKDAVRLLVGQELDDAVKVIVGLGARVGHEGKLPHVVRHARLLDLLLGEPHRRHFGVGVYDGGHRVVVDVPYLAGDILHAGNAVLLGLVRQHGALDQVADGKHARRRRLELAVHLHAAARVHLHAHLLQPKPLGIGGAAHRHQNAVHIHCLRLAALRGLHRQAH